jgi:lipid-A-disaccharide synthase
MAETLRLMVVAGEPSGDAHAAALVTELRNAAGDRKLELFGATGPKMRTAGVDSIVDTDKLSILGLIEIGRVLPKFLRAYKQLKTAAIERAADAVVLVDWPDFNLPLARALHRRGVKVIYYISPQLWAWRQHRVEQIRRSVDLLLAILPFEREWYEQRGVKQVEFVGHPLVGQVKPRFDRVEFCQRHQLDPSAPIVSLLPGSRHKEVVRILPPLLKAAALLKSKQPEVQSVLVVAPSRSEAEVRYIIAKQHSSLDLLIVREETREALAASAVAVVASGTATLEAALLETPMVIVYKESFVNWHTLGRLIKAEHYGLPNLIAGKRLVTELIQNDFTSEKVVDEVLRLLVAETNANVRVELREAVEKLGNAGASERAATRILEFVSQ